MAIQRQKYKGKWRYRWQESYVAPTGERKRKSSKWFATKAECQVDREAFLKKPENEKGVAAIPFTQIHREWVEFTKKDNVAKTQTDKIKAIETYFEPLLKKDIFKINPLMIKAEMNKEAFAALGTSRKNKILDFMRSIFEYAQDFYDLPRNPMRVIPRYEKTSEEKFAKQDLLTIADFNKFVEAIDKEHKVFKNLFIFLYWTGCRLNEGASITFEDVHGSSVTFWRQWIPAEKRFRELKTSESRRTISLDADLLKIINEQHNLYSKYPNFSERWFVFGGPRHLGIVTK